jgi:hypothetical protein
MASSALETPVWGMKRPPKPPWLIILNVFGVIA